MKKVIITEKEYRILKEMGENLESITQDEADFLEKTYGINVPYSEFFSKVHDVVASVLKIGNIPGTNMRYEPDSDVFHNYVKNAVKEYLKIQESRRSHRVNMNEVRRDIRGKRLVHHDESNTVEELETQEVSQEEFDKTFLELLGKCTKTVFLDGPGNECIVPSNRIDLRNDSGEWMFDIQFTGKNRHFRVNYGRVWSIFESRYELQDNEIRRLMKNQMKLRFGMDDITPEYYAY